MTRCTSTRKAGDYPAAQCVREATADSPFCAKHSPERKARMGAARSHTLANQLVPLLKYLSDDELTRLRAALGAIRPGRA